MALTDRKAVTSTIDLYSGVGSRHGEGRIDSPRTRKSSLWCRPYQDSASDLLSNSVVLNTMLGVPIGMATTNTSRTTSAIIIPNGDGCTSNGSMDDGQ